MTEFLSAPFLQDVTPETLASLVASLVNEMNRNRGGETIQWSSDVRRLYRSMSNLAAKMHETQEKFEVTLPITTNPIGIGLVEAWAKGWDWDSVLTLTDLDPGDLVRMVRRTADILRQVSKLEPNEFITKPLIESARLGYSLINREPVKELEVFASEDTF
jgi:superfamily II RNA helicase